jgi:pilus assembly protein Flp/PilA
VLPKLPIRLQLRTSGLLDERGASAVEYALLITFIAVVIAGAVAALGVDLAGIFSRFAAVFPDL